MRNGVKFNRTRGRRAAGTPAALWWGLAGIGVLILVAAVALVVLLAQGKGSPFGPGGFSLGLGNAKVNADGYAALRSGATLPEVEGILGGAGRPATDADFDAVCGDDKQMFTNPFFRERPMWEENNRRGLMRVWVNGNVRVLLTFSHSPEAGGRLLWKVLKNADGSVTSESGSQFGPPAPAPNFPNAPPGGGNVDWNQLVGTWEVEGDPRFRLRFGVKGAEKEIGDIFCFDGRPVREKVYTVSDVQVAGGRMTPQVELGTVNGNPIRNAALGTFWFENGKLLRDPGTGKPQQTLRRVG